VSEPIQMVRSRKALITVSPILLMRIVRVGTAKRLQKTKNAFPELLKGL